MPQYSAYLKCPEQAAHGGSHFCLVLRPEAENVREFKANWAADPGSRKKKRKKKKQKWRRKKKGKRKADEMFQMGKLVKSRDGIGMQELRDEEDQLTATALSFSERIVQWRWVMNSHKLGGLCRRLFLSSGGEEAKSRSSQVKVLTGPLCAEIPLLGQQMAVFILTRHGAGSFCGTNSILFCS